MYLCCVGKQRYYIFANKIIYFKHRKLLQTVSYKNGHLFYPAALAPLLQTSGLMFLLVQPGWFNMQLSFQSVFVFEDRTHLCS